MQIRARKHPAPQGALRRNTATLMTLNPDDRRHLAHQRGVSRPSPVGCLARSSRGTQSPDGPTEEAGCVDSHSRERRPFGLTSLEVGGRRCLRGRRWRLRQDAEKWLNRGRAGRSRGVLAEPVALQSLEMAQRHRSQRQGSESTQHQKVH